MPEAYGICVTNKCKRKMMTEEEILALIKECRLGWTFAGSCNVGNRVDLTSKDWNELYVKVGTINILAIKNIEDFYKDESECVEYIGTSPAYTSGVDTGILNGLYEAIISVFDTYVELVSFRLLRFNVNPVDLTSNVAQVYYR